jgi:hypothetical protein
MAPVFVIIAEVATYEPDKMAPIKDDHVLENLPSATTDPAFRHRIGIHRQLHRIVTVRSKFS